MYANVAGIKDSNIVINKLHFAHYTDIPVFSLCVSLNGVFVLSLSVSSNLNTYFLLWPGTG